MTANPGFVGMAEKPQGYQGSQAAQQRDASWV